ncbi:hypothetical protein [Roseivirga sp.]|uniref:hypothetical protein n=1 Tax=Roseivirga sp. TaxID=1964215 RepID=UPI003B8D1DB3
MKSLLMIILLIFTSSSERLRQNIDYRKEAFYKFVIESNEFNSLFLENEKRFFQIEVNSSNFEDYSVFMKRDLAKLNLVDRLRINSNKELNRFGNRRAYIKVFFSEIKNGLFFCEIFSHSKKKKVERKGLYVQGSSYLYLFQVTNNKELKLLKTSHFMNN